MPSLPVSRRSVLGVAFASAAALPLLRATPATAASAISPIRDDFGVAAHPFDLGQVRLTAGRLMENQTRTLNYLRFIDVDRLLYVFRANHGRSTGDAAANGGWTVPALVDTWG